jgi:hypothetical protein
MKLGLDLVIIHPLFSGRGPEEAYSLLARRPRNSSSPSAEQHNEAGLATPQHVWAGSDPCRRHGASADEEMFTARLEREDCRLLERAQVPWHLANAERWPPTRNLHRLMSSRDDNTS